MKALLRRIAHGLCWVTPIAPDVHKYESGAQAGYVGWIELPRIGLTLAYIRDDGSLQYEW